MLQSINPEICSSKAYRIRTKAALLVDRESFCYLVIVERGDVLYCTLRRALSTKSVRSAHVDGWVLYTQSLLNVAAFFSKDVIPNLSIWRGGKKEDRLTQISVCPYSFHGVPSLGFQMQIQNAGRQKLVSWFRIPVSGCKIQGNVIWCCNVSFLSSGIEGGWGQPWLTCTGGHDAQRDLCPPARKNSLVEPLPGLPQWIQLPISGHRKFKQ